MMGLLRYLRCRRHAGTALAPATGRFARFTGRARHVLVLAQEEAQCLGHNYIGTEHILLGLIREQEGVAARVLANLGLALPTVRNAVELGVGRGDRIVRGEVGLTPHAKKAIELAVDEARDLGHAYVGTEHLLLGLSREGDGIGGRLLLRLGASPAQVRAWVLVHLARR